MRTENIRLLSRSLNLSTSGKDTVEGAGIPLPPPSISLLHHYDAGAIFIRT